MAPEKIQRHDEVAAMVTEDGNIHALYVLQGAAWGKQLGSVKRWDGRIIDVQQRGAAVVFQLQRLGGSGTIHFDVDAKTHVWEKKGGAGRNLKASDLRKGQHVLADVKDKHVSQVEVLE